MLALLVVYFFVFSPDPDESAQTEMVDTTALEEPKIINEKTPDSTKTPISLEEAALQIAPDSIRNEAEQLILREKYGAFAPAAMGKDQRYSLENGLLKVELNSKGGLLSSAVLIDSYDSFWDSVNVRLWDEELSSMNIRLKASGNKEINTNELFFLASEHKAKATESTAASLTLKLPTTVNSKYLEIRYSLEPTSYQVKAELRFVGLDDVIDISEESTALEWTAAGLHNEKGISSERQRSSVFYRPVEDDRDYLSESREDEETLTEKLNWMAFKQNFFSAAVISETGFGKGAYLKSYPPENEEDTTHTMFYEAQLPIVLNSGNHTEKLSFYLGPNEYDRLKSTEVEEFHRIIDYGWWIFGWVNRNLIRPMFVFFSGLIGNYGLVILIITIIIKAALFPITWKNYLSSAKMRVLKPEIDEINKKYEGKDAMEKQKATMGLYRQTGVNPMAGCIPVLLQMPILYAMFRFFPASIELRQEGFLWADDLGGYDSILDLGFNIPLYGAHVSGFTLLMAISTFFYTRMSSGNMPETNQPGMPNMKLIMNFFPLMMLFFFNSLASGLSFYYFAANVISIGQMYVIKNVIIDEDKIHAKLQENKKKPRKKSAFQKRLEEMQKAQAAQKGNQKKKK